MNENQTNSWIFLSAGIGSGTKPVTFRSIVEVADGINHAVPTHKELQAAFKWLTTQGLMRKVGKGFAITADGSRLLAEASSKSNNIFDHWKYLEERFGQISN